MFNQFIINGRLTKDVEVRTNKNNKKFAFVTVACDRNYKAQDGTTPTDFLPVMVTGDKQVDFVEKYFHKGDAVIVEGTLQVATRGEGEQKHNEVFLNAGRFHFVTGGRAKAGNAEASANAPAASPAQAEGKPMTMSDVEVLDDDDLPF